MDLSSVINKNSDLIVNNIKQESIDTYQFIKNQFESKDVTKNYLFQFIFRSFYRIDNAGLKDELKERYFELMESNRNNEKIDLPSIVENLYEIKNYKGQNTIQFSFATKLANTINYEYPIYDSEVARMCEYRTPYTYKSKEIRIEEYMTSYRDLRSKYKNIIENGVMSLALEKFDGTLSGVESMPKVKKIDFLVWSAGKLEKDSKLKYA